MSHRVLVADDDALTRTLLSTVLDLEEYEVVLVADGDEALRRIANGDIDAAVIDHLMPGRSGLDVLDALRADDATAALPVVILSGARPAPDPATLVDAGADASLAKPFSPLQLIEVLDDLLEGDQ